jgi:diadenosine tetraphosphate (Ap4A) HIT family hydrolase
MNGFQLDPRLATDSAFIADGPLSQVRLMNDARYRWLLLVPRVGGAVEWLDLDGGQQRLLLAEINQVGALGNIVRQLHIHLVARHEGDAAWPGPVWGHGSAERHGDEDLARHVENWRQRLR